MSSLFYEDFEIGRNFTTGGRTVTDADLVLFSGISGDYTRLHLDEEYAKGQMFGGRVGHGMLGVSIATGLIAQLGTMQDTAMGLLEFSCRFTGPLRPGDTVYVRQVVTAMRETSKPDRGVVTFSVEMFNQRDEAVFAGEEKIMLRRRKR
jgi:acyl dehydratase